MNPGSPGWYALVGTGGALGSLLRWYVTTWANRRGPHGFAATVVVNLVGSLTLGVLTAHDLGAAPAAFAAVGLCGGLTTFSTLAFELATRPGRLRSTLLGSVTALAAFAIGRWLG
ncbi:MAG: CrcB family protein [Acidimicrobiia bacterium]|nr:CrcB family protein [Acidimicrobiia bacterium]MBP8181225.1 CrcB family protein [Acidimicrobiia bacterium]